MTTSIPLDSNDMATGRASTIERPRAGAVAGRTARQALRFGLIGVGSTVAYVFLYAALRSIAPATVANTVSLVITAVGNTAANRRLTFAVHGREHLARDHAAGLLAFAAALLITTVSLTALQHAAPDAGRSAELTVLVLANGAATLVRFVILRLAIGGRRPDRGPASPASGSVRPGGTRSIPAIERIVP